MRARNGILSGLVAFAAGDALGVPWEGCSRAQVAEAALVPLGERDGWPRGATSDDTAQLLLAAEALVAAPDAPERVFLERLSAELPHIRGSGPSTVAAVERFRATGALVAESGATNGAVMRAPAVGWALRDPVRRREVAVRLARTTHGAPEAQVAACVVAALAAWSLDGDHGDAYAEVRAAAALIGAPVPDLAAPAGEVGLGAVGTVGAVLALLADHDEPGPAMCAAVRLGGDTDTVAAIAGGVLGCRLERLELAWLDEVALPDPARLERLADALAGVERV